MYMTQTNQKLQYMSAALLGMALPTLILGRSVFAVIICIAVFLILIDVIKTASFTDLLNTFIAEWKRPLAIFLAVVFFLAVAIAAVLHDYYLDVHWKNSNKLNGIQ